MTAQPADAQPRDTTRVRILHAVPDPPQEAPQRPATPPDTAVETPVRPLDRVAVTVLAMFVGGPLTACIGQWWALAAWAAIWAVLVVWTARSINQDSA